MSSLSSLSSSKYAPLHPLAPSSLDAEYSNAKETDRFLDRGDGTPTQSHDSIGLLAVSRKKSNILVGVLAFSLITNAVLLGMLGRRTDSRDMGGDSNSWVMWRGVKPVWCEFSAVSYLLISSPLTVTDELCERYSAGDGSNRVPTQVIRYLHSGVKV